MATARFLLQGFRPGTHREALTWVLACPGVEKAILGVAFVRRSGVSLVAGEIGAVADKTSVFAGIRNGVTSAQGIGSLLAVGACVHAVDTGSASLLFHPKVYFARGADESRLVVGSPNLTAGGLAGNIEASLCVALERGAARDDAMAEAVESAFATLPESHPRHVFEVGAEDLPRLAEQGRLVDEEVHWPERAPRNTAVDPGDALPRISLRTPARMDRVRPPTETAHPGPPEGLELMWRSKPLVERDLNIPSTEGTHPTGSINLDKGLLDADTDHRHYFRDVVFAALAWKASGSPTVEEARARFRLVIKGVDRGEFDGAVAHTTSTETPSYLQRNAMTRLRWGEMSEYVRRRELLGRTLQLFRSGGKPDYFVIEID